MRRTQLPRVLVVLLAILGFLTVAAPAHADDTGPGVPSVSANFMPYSTRIATEHEWCVSGQANSGAVHLWTVDIRGWRSDGSTYNPFPATFSTARLSEYCVVFPKAGKPEGGVNITVTYTGTGDLTLTVLVFSAWLGGGNYFKDWHN